MRNRFLKILAVAVAVAVLFTACGAKEKGKSVQVGDMVFYYTGEPSISGEDDGSPEAVLKETVIDYRGTDGEERGLYFTLSRPRNMFQTLEEFDAMLLDLQTNQGLGEFALSYLKIKGTEAKKASVEFGGERITFVGFVYKDTSYLIYASAPPESEALVDSFIKGIELK